MATNIYFRLESGTVIIKSLAGGITYGDESLPAYEGRFPSNGELTASVINTDEIKVVDSDGNVILAGIPYEQCVSSTSGTQIASTATDTRDALNGQGYFGASTLETKLASTDSNLSTATGNITNLQKAIKTTTGDRGVYLNDNKYTSDSFLNLTSTEAKLQTGTTGDTYYSQSESSSGAHTFVVQAGSSGNKSAVTALTIEGSTSFNTALITFNQPATGLSATAVTSGTFSTSRIPNLSASKIQSGTFADARISESSVTQHITAIETNFSQLRQNLDVGAYGFYTSATNQDIQFTPSGTGSVHIDGTLKLKQHTAAPTAFDGGMYADNAGNLYFGVS